MSVPSIPKELFDKPTGDNTTAPLTAASLVAGAAAGAGAGAATASPILLSAGATAIAAGAAQNMVDAKVEQEQYCVFLSAAPKTPAFEESGTGDVDYPQALMTAMNTVTASKKTFFIRNMFSEQVIYDFIAKHKASSQTPLLHVMINAPEIGFTFTPEGLEKFKNAGGKLVITAVEFRKHLQQDFQRKLDTLQYLKVADAIVFLDEPDRDSAIELAKSIYSLHPSFIEKLKTAKIINVPPTILPSEIAPSTHRGQDIICFGMIRVGKGLAHVRNLAGLIKEKSDTNQKVLVVGHVQEHDPRAGKQLADLMKGLYSGKENEINAILYRQTEKNKIIKDLKTLLLDLQQQEKAGKLKADLPMEIHVDVPKDALPALFQRCTYCYLPMYRGATLRNSSISSAIAQSFVIYSHQDSITPQMLLNGKFKKAMVLMPNDDYYSYANTVFADIQKRQDDPKLNAETIAAVKQLMAEEMSPEVIAEKHIALYESLGVTLKPDSRATVNIGAAGAGAGAGAGLKAQR